MITFLNMGKSKMGVRTACTVIITLSSSFFVLHSASAQDVDATTGATKQTAKAEKQTGNLSRLHIGGYGEAVMTRNFYSQSFNRYKKPELYTDDKSHGRFDLPHVVLNLGYDFGKGWTLGSEIEFEHGGNGTAVEIEAEEAGEYEAEVEKGGEVNIEQFWINKVFAGGKFNIKAGEIIVPVGYSNAHTSRISSLPSIVLRARPPSCPTPGIR